MNIPWFKPSFWGKETAYVTDAIESTWISDGKYIQGFESRFSSIVGTNHTITVNNGTSALHLALWILDISPGDEVVVPGYTFAAPVNMLKMLGAVPVYVDVDIDTWCLDDNKIEAAITPKTKAIIPVHTYGNVCNMDSIMKLARQYHLHVVEDTAEAAFSKWNNQAAGTFGDVGCFSFQATKTLTMGEGGAITVKNEKLAERARLIRSHGMHGKKRYWHYEIGHNFRLTNYQAALGLAQLEYLDVIIQHKNRVLTTYQNHLSTTPGITFQTFKPGASPIVWSVAVLLDQDQFGKSELVRQRLLDAGIETRSGFYTFSDMPNYDAPILPISQEISDGLINLPSYTCITDDEIGYVCEQLTRLRY